MYWPHADIVTLVQLVFFALLLPFFVFHFATQEKSLLRTWWLFTAFCIAKVVGDALLIANLVQQNDGNPPNEGLLTPGSILSSIALAPLLLGMRMLLHHSRCTGYRDTRATQAPALALSVVAGSAFSVAGYILFIVNGKYTLGKTLVIVGAFLFLVAVLLVGAYGYHHMRHTPDLYRQSHYIYAVATVVSFPFLIVRIVYFICCAFALQSDGNFGAYATFSIFNGSWVAKLVMLVLMEIFVASIFAVAGLVFYFSSRRVTLPQDEYAMSITKIGLGDEEATWSRY